MSAADSSGDNCANENPPLRRHALTHSNSDVRLIVQDGLTLDQDLQQLRRTVAAASLSTFCLGYNTGIVAGAQKGIQSDSTFGKVSSGLASGELVSCALLGAAVGAFCGQAANVVGRRRALLAVAALFLLSPLAMAASPDFAFLLAARTISGMSIGVSSVLTNLYITEVSPAACRGQLGSWAPFSGTTGILVSYIVSAVLGPLTFGAWRWQFGLAALPALCQLVLQGSLPETPRWLLSQSRREDAKASLSSLFPKAAESCLEEELCRLEADLQSSVLLRSVNTFGLCSEKRHRTATAVGVAINVLQQVSGINVFIYFAPQILDDAGFGRYAMSSTAVVSLIQLAATAVLIKYIDQVGRRFFALWGIIGMLVGLVMLTGAELLKSAGMGLATTAWLSLGGMLLFRAAFSCSLGPLPYVMTSEFFAQEARASGVGLCWGSNWIANFAVSLSFPLLQQAMPSAAGHATIFGVYGFFCVVAYVFVRLLLPETTGVRLEAVGTQAHGRGERSVA